MNKEIKKEPKECMYSKDNYTDEDRKVLCEGCEEECEFNKKEEPASEELEKVVEEIVDPTVLNAYGVKEIANRLRMTMIESVSEEQVKELLIYKHEDKTCKENGNSLTQEPVSEDLKEAAKDYAGYRSVDKAEGFLAGANWQKKKDDHAIEIAHMAGEEEGKNIMKQQMMAKAVDATICLPYENKFGGYTQLVDVSRPLPVGSGIKVIVIKED